MKRTASILMGLIGLLFIFGSQFLVGYFFLKAFGWAAILILVVFCVYETFPHKPPPKEGDSDYYKFG